MISNIIAIGNELLNGYVIDTNSNFIQKKLNEYYIRVNKITILPDIMNQIVVAITNQIKECDFLFITGGLGPTIDDLTRQAISKALNKKLILNLYEYKKNENKYAKGVNLYYQSMFPANSMRLENKIGTASGMYLKNLNCHIFVLPGVPEELVYIYNNNIDGMIKNYLKYNNVIVNYKLSINLFGCSESSVDSFIRDKIVVFYDISWEICANYDGLYIRIYTTQLDYKKIFNHIKSLFTNKFNKYIYSFEGKKLLKVIKELIISTNTTITTVESCTGGMLGSIIASIKGISKYYIGSYITYSNSFKQDIGVKKSTIDKYGVFSENISREMALCANNKLKSDVTISITGITKPFKGLSNSMKVGSGYITIYNRNKNKFFTLKHLVRYKKCSHDYTAKSFCYNALNILRLSLTNII